jgi:hypothetical protein
MIFRKKKVNLDGNHFNFLESGNGNIISSMSCYFTQGTWINQWESYTLSMMLIKWHHKKIESTIMIAINTQFWPKKILDNDTTCLVYHSFWYFDITCCQSQLRHWNQSAAGVQGSRFFFLDLVFLPEGTKITDYYEGNIAYLPTNYFKQNLNSIFLPKTSIVLYPYYYMLLAQCSGKDFTLPINISRDQTPGNAKK